MGLFRAYGLGYVLDESGIGNRGTPMIHRNTGTTADPGGGTAGAEAWREAQGAASEIKQQAQRLADEARQRGAALFEGQRQAAAAELGGMVDALRRTAQNLGSEQRPAPAQWVGRAADSLDRIAGNLRQQDARALLGQVEDYARQHPGLFFGGSVAAGVLLARYLKATARASTPDAPDRPF
ncbi:hypothetical protein MishRS11D_44910 (plasmid) [Methylomagnum ishizawai]|nr:hypothetical protein MishRS11D_44910 [Methylomagnum ishizawai]